MRVRRFLWLIVACFAFGPAPAHATTPAEAAAIQAANESAPLYTLPPAKMEKAVALHQQRIVLYFAYTAVDIAVLVLLLTTGFARRLRDYAAVAASKWRMQGMIFLPIMLLVMTLLHLPLNIYGHHLGLQYGLSVQQWPGWAWDFAKQFLLQTALTTAVGIGVYALIRRRPHTWWWWLWAAMLPCIVFLVFIAPVFIDPLFNTFEPLQNTNPALVTQLEKVVQRSGVDIPPDRMYLMRASAKVTGLNAYVTGVGASKRVVVWDTTIAAATPDEIAFIFGHETGHYVMQHLWLGMGYTATLVLILLPLGVWMERGLIRRFGQRLGIHDEADWAGAPVLMLVFTLILFASDPAANAFSRMLEHDADVYGQEVVHGVAANPQQAGAHGFQVLGETALEDPRPHPLEEFWLSNHPPIWFRTKFSAAYDPWKPGLQPKYFSK